MEVKCLDCNGVLFKKVSLDGKGNWAIDPATPIKLEHDESDSFFRCPHCSTKNVVIETTSPSGLMQLKIHRVKKD